MSQVAASIPGIPGSALDAIQDENTRVVLRAIVDGWGVRNGEVGSGANAFVTRSDLTGVVGSSARDGFKGVWPSTPWYGPKSEAEIAASVSDIEAALLASTLFDSLNGRISQNEVSIQAEQNARIAAVQAVADQLAVIADNMPDGVVDQSAAIAQLQADLATEVQNRLNLANTQGSQIESLQTTTANQATSMSGLVTRVGAAESTISNLQTTSTSQANSLTALTTRVGSAESSISTLSTTTANQASTLTTLDSKLGAAETNITNLQTTSTSQANSLTALTTRVGSAESGITTLQGTTATQATSIANLTTRVGSAESSISTLSTTTANQASTLTTLDSKLGAAETNITNLQTTSTSQANSLTTLTTRVGSAESSISTLSTTTANQASTLTSISATLATKTKTYFQATQPASGIGDGDVWYDSDDNNKPYRWNTNAWVPVDDKRVASAVSAITQEATARANADNSITESMTSQFSAVNGNISQLNTKATTLTNDVASMANSVSTLSATAGSNTTAIQTEATARANADNTINSRYSVKIDTNGYVSGFGLISEANNAAPTSSFIIRADKFGIGSPSGPGVVVPAIPFSVLTTTDTNGTPPGVYINDAFIKHAAVSTLRIGPNAVIVPDCAVLPQGTPNYATTYPYTLDEISEFRWADNGALMTLSELDAATTGSLAKQRKDAIQYVAADMGVTFTNPIELVDNTSYWTVNRFCKTPPRDYMGQPVLVLAQGGITFQPIAGGTQILYVCIMARELTDPDVTGEFTKVVYSINRDYSGDYVETVLKKGWQIVSRLSFSTSHSTTIHGSQSYTTVRTGAGLGYFTTKAGALYEFAIGVATPSAPQASAGEYENDLKLAVIGMKR